MQNKFLLFILVIFMGSTLMSGCTKEESTGSLTINLRQFANETPLVLNKWLYHSPAGHPYKIRRLQMVLSDIELERTDGTRLAFDMYHYFEFGRSETYSFTLQDLPAEDFNKLIFNFGLDEEKNLDNAYPSDYDMINFKWPVQMGQGYHYMRFEVTADSLGTGVIKDFNLHTGASQGNQNYIKFKLPIEEMHINNNHFLLDLFMDMNEWLQNPQIYDWEQFGHGIMGNQEAQEILKINGQSVFSAEGPVLSNDYYR